MSARHDMPGLSLALSSEISMEAWLEVTPAAVIIASIEKLVEVKKGDVTLRDRFAMHALGELMACALDEGEKASLVAEAAYMTADAMLKAREAS